MLLGVAAVAAPIIAHLMNRRTRQRVVFPTIRLLLESTSTQSRFYQIRRWVLLALRCLAVLFLAAAFAQPGCSTRDHIVRSDDGVSVVYVLDLSASLGRQGESGNLLDAMRAEVSRSLSELKRGVDRANVVIADARPQPMFPGAQDGRALTANLDAIRSELPSLKVTADRADLSAAILLAGQMLEDAPGLKRLVVVSDMQKRNWEAVDLAVARGRTVASDVQIHLVPLTEEAVNNIALQSPRTAPVRALANRPMNLLVNVANFSNVERDVVVAATVDGQASGTESIRLKAGEARELAFEHSFANTGLHRVEFSIADDALPIDNRAYLTVDISRKLRVFVIGDDNPATLGSSGYFLLRALMPRNDDRDVIDAAFITSADLVATDLSQAAAVFVGDVDALSPQAVDALHAYMKAGGGVIWFVGGDAVGRNVQQFSEQVGDAVLPLQLRQKLALDTVGEAVRIDDGKWHAPALADFDPQSRELLQRIRLTTIHDVEKVSPGAQVLLQFAGGRPALALQSVGEGRFVIANFSPSLKAGDLGKYGSFPAMVHSLLRFVQPRRDWRFAATVGAGLNVTLPVPVGEPSGRVVLQDSADELLTPTISRDAQRLVVQLQRLRTTGFHSVLCNDIKHADVAVNVDWRESDLSLVDAVTLKQALASNGTNVVVQSASQGDEAAPLRGRDLWQWFVVGAMLMIGAELAWLAVWKR